MFAIGSTTAAADAHAGSVHVANEPERALALYGRGAFGLPVEDNLV